MTISKIQAFPTTDGIFVVWNVTSMIDNCLGFALYRQEKNKAAAVVDTWVGFEDQETGHKPGDHRPSTQWPVQKTSWTDYMAPDNAPVRYGVVPVLKNGATGVKPAGATPDLWSDYVSATPAAPLSPWFNRGTISAQWLTRAIGGNPKAAQTLEKAISTKGNKIRDFLMGALGARLLGLLADARKGGSDVYVALYELNDPELVAALCAMKGKAHVVLGNSTGKSDATAKETEKNAGVLKKAGVDIVRRKIAPARYAHNKFVVFCDKAGKPKTIWTGSTNWTRTGLCTQNNNGLEIGDDGVAAAYLKHWHVIYKAASTNPKSLATDDDKANPFTIAGTKTSVWFTPTTKSGDLAQASALVDAAKHGVVCLMLNPGNAGLLGPVLQKAQDNSLYVRGVLNNFPAQGKDSPKDQLKLLTTGGQQQTFKGKQIADVIRPAGIDASADWWEREIKNTGKFMIAVHSKVIVIDPAGENPVVMTGSHNFSDRASTKNDDNLVIIQGDNALALTYAARIVSIYDTYRWQAWRNTPDGQKDKGLKRSDDWLRNRLNQGWAETETRFWLGKI
jgi:phosphatidylserine/phosphatidylglycerophosphate/cardiolipin synthase-like enzyme